MTPSPENPDLNTGLDFETSLRLSPQQGTAGTQVTITAVGYGACVQPTGSLTGGGSAANPVFLLEWAGKSVDLSHASIEGRDVVVPYTVPDDPATQYEVTASCGYVSNTAEFTVVPPPKEPTFTLDAPSGHRGSQITATGSDFACGSSETVQLFWDDDGSPLAEAQPPTFTVPIAVPDEAPNGEHTVVARCQYHSAITASQPFEVTKTEPPVVTPAPTLSVQPTIGHPGDQVRITGERFACTDRAATVQLSWDDGTQLATPTVDESGHFETSVLVSSNADAGGHIVRAACADDSVAMVTTFTVVANGSRPPPEPTPAAMAVQPASGQRGDEMRVAGERFVCANGTVELSWDDGTQLGNPSVDASGGFATSVPVPANADVRSHTVRAACSDGSIALTTAFTVIAEPSPSPPPPPPPGIWGWVIALVLVVATVLGVRHIRHRRHPHPDTRVHVVGRPGGPPVATVQETPARGEATHAIRLEARFDSGIQTIREVNDDYTRAQ